MRIAGLSRYWCVAVGDEWQTVVATLSVVVMQRLRFLEFAISLLHSCLLHSVP